jgi:hypothetical protein
LQEILSIAAGEHTARPSSARAFSFSRIVMTGKLYFTSVIFWQGQLFSRLNPQLSSSQAFSSSRGIFLFLAVSCAGP